MTKTRPFCRDLIFPRAIYYCNEIKMPYTGYGLVPRPARRYH
jgi:hypothetical protein